MLLDLTFKTHCSSNSCHG